MLLGKKIYVKTTIEKEVMNLRENGESMGGDGGRKRTVDVFMIIKT